MAHSRNAEHSLLLPFPQEIRNEITAYLDPFSLANAIRSGKVPNELTSRALFGGLWTLFLSMQEIEELKNGLTERGNAILIGYGLDYLYNTCLSSDKGPPYTPIHIILTWVYAKESINIKERSLQIPEYNVVLWIKKPDILFNSNGITVEALDNFINTSYEAKILYFKDNDYKLHLVTTRPREPDYTRPVRFQFEFDVQSLHIPLCLQSWKRASGILLSPVDNIVKE